MAVCSSAWPPSFAGAALALGAAGPTGAVRQTKNEEFFNINVVVVVDRVIKFVYILVAGPIGTPSSGRRKTTAVNCCWLF